MGIVAIVLIVLFLIVVLVYLIGSAIQEYATPPPDLVELRPGNAHLCDHPDCELVLQYTLRDVNHYSMTIEPDGAEAWDRVEIYSEGSGDRGLLGDTTESDGDERVHTINVGRADIFSGGPGKYHIRWRLVRVDPVTKENELTTTVTIVPANETVTDLLVADEAVPLVDNDPRVVTDPGVGLEVFEKERFVSGPGAGVNASFSVCSATRIRKLAAVRCGALFSSKDPNFSQRFPSVDTSRTHPEQLEVEVLRGDDVLYGPEVIAEGDERTLDPGIEVDGEDPISIRARLQSGPEGNFQHGFNVFLQLEYEFDCPM